MITAQQTPRERWLAGLPPRDHDREDAAKYAEYEACRPVSDADRAYERMERILRHGPADAPLMAASGAS
jgi:hypothetical protein